MVFIKKCNFILKKIINLGINSRSTPKLAGKPESCIRLCPRAVLISVPDTSPAVRAQISVRNRGKAQGNGSSGHCKTLLGRNQGLKQKDSHSSSSKYPNHLTSNSWIQTLHDEKSQPAAQKSHVGNADTGFPSSRAHCCYSAVQLTSVI